MPSVSLGWALCWRRQLTPVGLAVATVFGSVMVLQTCLVSNCENRNKSAKEEVAQSSYYQVCFFSLNLILLTRAYFVLYMLSSTSAASMLWAPRTA
jgi:hypothetical protein